MYFGKNKLVNVYVVGYNEKRRQGEGRTPGKIPSKVIQKTTCAPYRQILINI